MPALPITIGELTDVPTFDSPIASPWAQEVTRRTVHRFTTTAARDAAYPAAAAGRGAICIVGVNYPILYRSTGVSWVADGVYSAWAPTFANVAPLGTSTYQCARIGDQGFVRAQLNIGAGGVTGWPLISLPWPAAIGNGLVSTVQFGRAATSYFGWVAINSTIQFGPVYLDPSRAAADLIFVSPTVPFAWGSAGDSFIFNFNYMAQPLG